MKNAKYIREKFESVQPDDFSRNKSSLKKDSIRVKDISRQELA